MSANQSDAVYFGVNDGSKATLDSSGRLTLNGAINVGSSDGSLGQILVSQGAGVAPVWTATSTIFSSLLADNGLTNSSGVLKLGGTLNQATTLTQSGNAFIFDQGFMNDTSGGVRILSNQLTTGTALNIDSSYNLFNSTNGLLRVANTSASTNGILARFQANSTAGSGLTVLANGNIGVNTTNPTYKLQVQSGDLGIKSGKLIVKGDSFTPNTLSSESVASFDNEASATGVAVNMFSVDNRTASLYFGNTTNAAQGYLRYFILDFFGIAGAYRLLP
jgi:hypothetical protein